MRMYELWKLDPTGESFVRLEDAGGPVLFLCVPDAEEYSRREPDSWRAAFAFKEVRAGTA